MGKDRGEKGRGEEGGREEEGEGNKGVHLTHFAFRTLAAMGPGRSLSRQKLWCILGSLVELHEGSLVVMSSLRWKGFVEQVSFKPGNITDDVENEKWCLENEMNIKVTDLDGSVEMNREIKF